MDFKGMFEGMMIWTEYSCGLLGGKSREYLELLSDYQLIKEGLCPMLLDGFGFNFTEHTECIILFCPFFVTNITNSYDGLLWLKIWVNCLLCE